MNASPKRWSHFAKQLAPKLARFEVALRVAIPHVPRPVRGDLRIALGQVRIGRVPLAASRDFDDYTAKTHWAVLDGPSAMMEASGLVGHACGGLRVADFS
ncbi:MAG TPA: hypothetical protein VGP84_12160, partial [Gemmatimonadaceae bacterium]|nr:hypothetical protein [Gemmatimonadaceae bacterium]